jgi:hypothetical protein
MNTFDMSGTSAFDNDVALEPEDKARVHADRQEWFKMTKGQTQLCAFLYFHPVDATAVKSLRVEAKKAGRSVTPEELRAAARRALETKASSSNPTKSVEQLTAAERLDLTAAQFKSFDVHYDQGIGFVLSRLGKDGGAADLVWKKLPEPRKSFATLLLLYPMTGEGKIDIDATRRGEWRMMPWRFGAMAYRDIWSLNDGLRSNGMGIANQDLRLECIDATFQRIKVSFVGKSIWQGSPNFQKTVLTRALELYGSLVPFRAMSTDQLREKLGGGGEETGRLLESV